MNKPPCRTCGKPVHLDNAKLCNGCWEVEGRIEEYLKAANGRQLVARLLGQAATAQVSDDAITRLFAAALKSRPDAGFSETAARVRSVMASDNADAAIEGYLKRLVKAKVAESYVQSIP
jgi:hypothetical protein